MARRPKGTSVPLNGNGASYHPYGEHLPEAAAFSDDDFLNSIVGALPEDKQRNVAMIEKIKSIYVECGRDKVLAKTLSSFVEMIVARVNGCREGGVFFVTGDSGAGKTRAVEHMLAANPSLQPQIKPFGTINPVVSISLAGPDSLKTLGLNLLDRIGYTMVQDIEVSKLWAILLPSQLHLRKVLVVHIDETQHMLKHTAKDQDRKELAKSLKGAINYKPWPVSFILSGMPETIELSKLDEQFERRGVYEFLPDVDIDHERILVENIMRRLSDAAGIDCERTISSDIPERIAHTARYRYGRIAKLVMEGLIVAFERNSMVLDREHFARAYMKLSHARGHDEMNPFLVDDYRILPSGNFLRGGRDS